MPVNNNFDTVELVTTLRVAPLNGAPSSEEYNDSSREILTDLATLADTVNQNLLPLINSLPSTVPLSLDGDGIYAADPTDTAPLFLDSTDGSQLTIAQVFTRLNMQITQATATVADMQARILQLQTRLATTNQNDVQQAIQGFQSLLQQMSNRLALDEQTIATLQSFINSDELSITSVQTTIGGLQTSISAAQTELTTLSGAVAGLVVASTGPAWKKFIVTTAAGNWMVNGVVAAPLSSTTPTQQVPLFTTAARTVIHALVIKTSTAFVATASTVVQATAGIPTSVDALMISAGDVYDPTLAPSPTNLYVAGGVQMLNAAAYAIILNMSVPFASPSAITAGVLEVDLLTSVLP
jgi:hypothetical protein